MVVVSVEAIVSAAVVVVVVDDDVPAIVAVIFELMYFLSK